jgi:hypothetical protein
MGAYLQLLISQTPVMLQDGLGQIDRWKICSLRQTSRGLEPGKGDGEVERWWLAPVTGGARNLELRRRRPVMLGEDWE